MNDSSQLPFNDWYDTPDLDYIFVDVKSKKITVIYSNFFVECIEDKVLFSGVIFYFYKGQLYWFYDTSSSLNLFNNSTLLSDDNFESILNSKCNSDFKNRLETTLSCELHQFDSFNDILLLVKLKL